MTGPIDATLGLHRYSGGDISYVPFSAWWPQATPHQNQAAAGALLFVCHAVAHQQPGHQTQVFGQGECAQVGWGSNLRVCHA